ncbi:MAG TPA: ABC transporter substrate-binding protein [Candidatus Deferrimicrobiaceae bacterium]|jgi:branched-chain amino acid transport system substrate-binding protein
MKMRMGALATLFLLICSGSAFSATKVKLGFVNTITGAEAPIGENLTNGVTLALEDLKKKGIDVDLVKEDDTGKPEKAMSAFEKLATRDGVAGVVGPYTSACANAVASRADQYKVPLLVPVAAKEEITQKGYKYVYRLNAPADVYSSVIMDTILGLGKPKTIAYIYANTDFGISTVKTAKEYAAKRGLKEVADEKYQKGAPDFRSTLTKIKALAPDLVFMVSYEVDAITLMRQSREIGLTPKAFLGAGAGFTTSQFLAQKEVSNHVFSSTQWTDDVNWPGAKDFYKRYVAKFKKEPSYHAACAYEAMRIMAETAAASGSDREKTRAALRKGAWKGIMGDVKFIDYGKFTNQNRHEMLVQQIQDGKYETVSPAKYATKKPIYPFKWK